MSSRRINFLSPYKLPNKNTNSVVKMRSRRIKLKEVLFLRNHYSTVSVSSQHYRNNQHTGTSTHKASTHSWSANILFSGLLMHLAPEVVAPCLSRCSPGQKFQTLLLILRSDTRFIVRPHAVGSVAQPIREVTVASVALFTGIRVVTGTGAALDAMFPALAPAPVEAF